MSVQKISRTYDRYASTVTVHDMVVLEQGLDIFHRIFSRYPSDINELLKSGVVVGDTKTYLGELTLVINKSTNVMTAGFKDMNGDLHDLDSFMTGAINN